MDMLDKQYSQLFTNALSSDKQIRESAEKTLSDLASTDPTKFLLNLSFELADEAKPTGGRQMAAAVMKNFITISVLKQLVIPIWKTEYHI